MAVVALASPLGAEATNPGSNKVEAVAGSVGDFFFFTQLFFFFFFEGKAYRSERSINEDIQTEFLDNLDAPDIPDASDISEDVNKPRRRRRRQMAS